VGRPELGRATTSAAECVGHQKVDLDLFAATPDAWRIVESESGLFHCLAKDGFVQQLRRIDQQIGVDSERRDGELVFADVKVDGLGTAENNRSALWSECVQCVQ
jgi:hypothetical protein